MLDLCVIRTLEEDAKIGTSIIWNRTCAISTFALIADIAVHEYPPSYAKRMWLNFTPKKKFKNKQKIRLTSEIKK